MAANKNNKTAPPATQENRALAGEQATYRIRNHLEAFGCDEGNPRFCVPRPQPRATFSTRRNRAGVKIKIPTARNFLPAFWIIYAPSDWTGGGPQLRHVA
jgi:hypothetical protein